MLVDFRQTLTLTHALPISAIYLFAKIKSLGLLRYVKSLIFKTP